MKLLAFIFEQPSYILFDMQHDRVLKKLNFDLLAPRPGQAMGGGVCRQNINYHVDAYVIPFNLICKATML